MINITDRQELTDVIFHIENVSGLHSSEINLDEGEKYDTVSFVLNTSCDLPVYNVEFVWLKEEKKWKLSKVSPLPLTLAAKLKKLSGINQDTSS